MTFLARHGSLALLFAAGLTTSLALLGATATGRAASLAVSIFTATTPMTATTNFTTAHATAACPSGSTLVGGGDEITLAGAPTPNNGAVTLGLVPSDGSGNPVAAGTTTPTNWTTWAGYSGMAPGTDAVTTYGMCLSGGPAATVIATATTSGSSLGPVTAVCPSGTSLVGGGGGYTAFPSGDNTKVYDSFPSDAAGDLPSNNMTGPTAWTFKGNSNDATGGETTTAVAFCATDVSVSTLVAASIQTANAVTGGALLPSTVACPSGTTLLAGGSAVTNDPTGAGTGGQGVHVIGDFPSDGSGNPVTTSTGSWTVISEDGGQNLSSLSTEAFALCATAVSGGTTSTGTTSTTGATSSGGGGGASTDTTAGSTPTTTTTATAPTSGGTPAATTPAPSKSVTLHAGKAGSLTVGSGAETVTIKWPKNVPSGATLTAVPTTPFIAKSHGVPATTSAIQLVVRKGSTTLTHFAAPFDISFAGAPGNISPAFTVNDFDWDQIPEVGSPHLLPGLTDGYYRDKLGNLHILTMHATIFGLLKSGIGLVAGREPLALGYQPPVKLRAGSRSLALTVVATRPASLTVALSRNGRTVSSWRRTVTVSAKVLELPLNADLSGSYRLSLKASAGRAQVSHAATLRVAARSV